MHGLSSECTCPSGFPISKSESCHRRLCAVVAVALGAAAPCVFVVLIFSLFLLLWVFIVGSAVAVCC